MKTTTVIIALFTMLATQGFSQSKNFIDQPYLETESKVDTLVTPDVIYLNIVLTEKDTKGKVSIEELESKMVLALKNIEIDTESNLSLNDLASNFSKYVLKSQDVLKVKSYTLIVNDAIKAGKVIIELEKINHYGLKVP